MGIARTLRCSALVAILTLSSVSLALDSTDILSIAPKEGHSLFNDSIDQAKTSIEMMMFHLSDPTAIDKLIAAQGRGVQVSIILDQKTLQGTSAQNTFKLLQSKGIDVHKSSAGFSITHAKSAVFDKSWALITTINLSRTEAFTRDFGLKTTDPDIINEFESVFAADLKNADSDTAETPPLSNPKLVWSPVNSHDRIIGLIRSAHSTIYLEVENLGDNDVQAALKEQAQAGIKVLVVVPACVEGGGARNKPFMEDLASAGVDARLSMPPYSATNPYIHAKSIVVDEKTFYVGSENFSFNSLEKARELGIIETDAKISSAIIDTINYDSSLSAMATQATVLSCAN